MSSGKYPKECSTKLLEVKFDKIKAYNLNVTSLQLVCF